MAVFLVKNYAGYTASATVAVTFPDSTESALIAQGLATAANTTAVPSVFGGPDQFATIGGNMAPMNAQAGQGTPASLQGPAIVTNIALGSLALTSYETNGVAQTAGTFNFSEIYIPHWNTWTKLGWLNGTTVGTTNAMAAIWGSNGVLLGNSAVAGALTTGTSVMQNVALLTPLTLAPGRYFIGVQVNTVGADTIRHVLVANGANVICGSVAGTFGTVPATITVPTTFTTAIAPICQIVTT